MARDALEPALDPETGAVTFPFAPRLPSGEIDWSKLGAQPRFYDAKDEDGKRHRVDMRVTVPHPTTGEPIYPT